MKKFVSSSAAVIH